MSTSETTWNTQSWKTALESSNADQMYEGLGYFAQQVANQLEKPAHEALKIIDDLYQATITSTPSNGSDVAQTAQDTARDLVQGMHLAVHGYFEYTEAKPNSSYELVFSQIRRKIQAGSNNDAQELFKKLSSLILHGTMHIDSYADLSLPSDIPQEAKNWASALGMLLRNHS